MSRTSSNRMPAALIPLAALVATFALAPSLRAQGAVQRGTFVVRLGSDTVAVEQFTRSRNRVEGDVIQRSPATRVAHYVATLDNAGRLTRLDYSVRRADGTPVTGQPLAVTLTVAGDSATRVIAWQDSTATKKIAAPAGVLPLVPGSYATYELPLAQLRAMGMDSMSFAMLSPAASAVTTVPVTLAGQDSARIITMGSPLLLRVDRTGQLLGADGRLTTVQVTVQRVPLVDVRALATAFAARDAAGTGLGQMSPGDTARGTIGSANISVAYSRPARRGRVIWGGLVPWGKVWRTGANAATQLSTSADLTIGGVAVPAGSYTLFTLPTPTGTRLIINRQTGQWGTAYDESKDLARVDMTRTQLQTPAERFTIAIVPAGSSSGTLSLAWDTTQLSVPVTAK